MCKRKLEHKSTETRFQDKALGGLRKLKEFCLCVAFHIHKCLFAMLNEILSFLFPNLTYIILVYSRYESIAVSNDMLLHSQCLPTSQDRYSSVALRGLMIGVMALPLRKGSPEVFSAECVVDTRMASTAPGI